MEQSGDVKRLARTGTVVIATGTRIVDVIAMVKMMTSGSTVTTEEKTAMMTGTTRSATESATADIVEMKTSMRTSQGGVMTTTTATESVTARHSPLRAD